MVTTSCFLSSECSVADPCLATIGPFDKTKLDFFLKRVNPQQCLFAKRWVFDKIGPFNKKYKICGDYDWFLRSFKNGIKIRFIDEYIAFVNIQGRSFTRRYEVINERIEVVYKNSSPIYFLIYFIYASLRKIKHIFLEYIWTPLIHQK